MDERCPFCWSRHITRAGGRLPAGSRFLMECQECERWYWAHSGEEVPRLFEICATALFNPGRCEEGVQEIMMNSGGTGFPRRRAAEFNRICSDCLNARFMADKIAIHVRMFLPARKAAAGRLFERGREK